MKTEKKKMRKKKKHEYAFFILLVAMLISSSLASAYSAINCTVTVPAEKPDLAISASDIHFDPAHPVIDDTVVITASVHNIGGADANDVDVSFYKDTKHIETKIVSIPSLGMKNISVSWAPDKVGFHNILVKVDKDNLIEETNEGNNQAQKSTKVTKPLAISLTASPEIITANGTDTSTITAVLTDEFGRRVNGTEVTFSTSLGTIESPKSTVNGVATTTLTSSASPGTAIVTGSATINNTYVEDTVYVVFEKLPLLRQTKPSGTPLRQSKEQTSASLIQT